MTAVDTLDELDTRSGSNDFAEGPVSVQENMLAMGICWSGQPSWSAYGKGYRRKHRLSMAPYDTLGEDYDPKAPKAKRRRPNLLWDALHSSGPGSLQSSAPESPLPSARASARDSPLPLPQMADDGAPEEAFALSDTSHETTSSSCPEA